MRTTIELECSECGKPTVKLLADHKTNLKRGSLPFCSRPCSAHYFNRTLPSFRHGGRKEHQYGPFKRLANGAKNRAKRKGIECSVDAKFLSELWATQKGVCPYTGIQMALLKYDTSKRTIAGGPNQVSVDRKDSSMGYIPENVELVCLSVNYGKNGYSREQMMEFFQSVKSRPDTQ